MNVRFGVNLLLSDCVALRFRVNLLLSDCVALDFPPAIRENTEIKIHKTTSVPVIYMRVKRWSLALRRERKLKMVWNMALRSVLGSKVEELTVDWGYGTVTRHRIDTSHQI